MNAPEAQKILAGGETTGTRQPNKPRAGSNIVLRPSRARDLALDQSGGYTTG
jgi:hypothetical protein